MSDLRGYNAREVEVGINTNKIIGAIVVATAIGAIGTYSYATGMWDSPPVQTMAPRVASNNVPSPPIPTVQQRQTVIPPVAPEADAPTQPSPPPVKAARKHVSAPAATRSRTATDNSSDRISPSPVAPPDTAPDTSIAPPATAPAAPTQSAPAQPIQSTPAQPAPEQPAQAPPPSTPQ